MPMPSSGKYNARNLLLWFVALLAVLFVATSFFIRSFDINDYSHWISEQIEESTGYQVDFQSINGNLYGQSRLSISGLSLSIEQHELLYIEQINIDIKNIDLWQRQLEIELIELSGVNIVAQGDHLTKFPLGGSNTIATDLNSPKSVKSIDKLALQRLHVNQLRVHDLNVDISNGEASLHLQEANLSSDHLLVIENNQLNTNLLTANLQLDFITLNIQRSVQEKLQIKGLNLQSEFSLLALQATLLSEIQQIELDTIETKKITFDNVSLDLQLDKNQLFLHRLFTNVFAGQLDLQATATFVVNPFSSTTVSIKQFTVDSLLLKDMQLQVPVLNNPLSAEDQNNKQPLVLPIESMLLRQVDLQNLHINSADAQQAIIINNLTRSVHDLYIIKNHHLLGLPEKGTSSAFFTLKFDYLSWFDRELEQFSVAGSLTQDDQSMMLIKSILLENKK